MTNSEYTPSTNQQINNPIAPQEIAHSKPMSRRSVIILLTILLVLLLLIISGIYYFSLQSTDGRAPREPFSSRFSFEDKTITQTCLAAPNSKGCADCKGNGTKGNTCDTCENIFKDKSDGLQIDEEYYKEYCSDSVSDNRTDDQVQVTQPSQTSLALFGTEWPGFDYELPFGGNVSGIAPVSHTFSTDSSTNSGLGNSIDFSFDSYDSTTVTNVQISIVQSEGVYTYYEEIPKIVNEGLNLYRISSPDMKSILYTDSYETTKCPEYVNPYLSEPTVIDVCGTGMLFGHGYYASCKYDNDMDKAVAMCDEFFKNLSIK